MTNMMLFENNKNEGKQSSSEIVKNYELLILRQQLCIASNSNRLVLLI